MRPVRGGLQKTARLELRGEKLRGAPVDFSHGDVDAHEPTPGSFEAFAAGVQAGGSQAYTEYRGKLAIRAELAEKLSAFTGAVIDPAENIILTPGTQGALFLAMGCSIMPNEEAPENLITIMGPSKTESLGGYRLGAAFGTAEIINRMEKLQAIMALRCSGYNQAVFSTWFTEPVGWMEARVEAHQRIRDTLLNMLKPIPGVFARPTEGGSYLFVTIPELDVSLHQFIQITRELADVTVTPGTEFGPQFLHEFRINFSQDKERAEAAMERLLDVMERYRKQGV